MALTALPRIVSLTISFLIAASTAIAQAAKVFAARFHHSGVYDEARKKFLIYGGYTWDQGSKKLGDVWGWNGSTWQLVGDTGVRKIVAPLAFDSKRLRTVMFGGSGDSDANDGKLHRLEGETWQLVKDVPYLGREDASLGYDSKRDRLVLFGGRNEEGSLRRYLGIRWERLETDLYGGTVSTLCRGCGIGFGAWFNDLVWRVSASCCSWRYVGVERRRMEARERVRPGPRSWPGLAYDSKRKRAILFGGEDEKGQFYSDTWAWDGKVWTRIANEGPRARIQFAMGSDSCEIVSYCSGASTTSRNAPLDDF